MSSTDIYQINVHIYIINVHHVTFHFMEEYMFDSLEGKLTGKRIMCTYLHMLQIMM
jgi:hypothetical protein